MSPASSDASRILQWLIEGIDPTTGEDIPTDSILNRAEIIRALLTAVWALDAEEARKKRREQLPTNAGRTWSAEEDAALVDAFERGVPVATIAAERGRSVRSIEARLTAKGLLSPEHRKTIDRFEPR